MNESADRPQASPPPARRGFASMDPERLRAISSRGGRAPRSTPQRGFALMDEARRLEVSRQGLAARRRAAPAASPDDPAARS